MDGVKADVDDPGPDEGPPANAQYFVTESCPQETSVAVFVHQAEPLNVVVVQGVHGQTHQDHGEIEEVGRLPKNGGLV